VKGKAFYNFYIPYALRKPASMSNSRNWCALKNCPLNDCRLGNAPHCTGRAGGHDGSDGGGVGPGWCSRALQHVKNLLCSLAELMAVNHKQIDDDFLRRSNRIQRRANYRSWACYRVLSVTGDCCRTRFETPAADGWVRDQVRLAGVTTS